MRWVREREREVEMRDNGKRRRRKTTMTLGGDGVRSPWLINALFNSH